MHLFSIKNEFREKTSRCAPPFSKSGVKKYGIAGSLYPADSRSENTAFVFHKAELTYEQTANFASLQMLKARQIRISVCVSTLCSFPWSVI